MPRLTDEELKWLKECYRLALINEEVWTRDDQKSWEEMCDAVPGIILEAERKHGDPVVNIDATQAYADKVLEVAAYAPAYVDGRNLGQISEETGIVMADLQRPGVVESILRAQDIAHRIQWAEQMIQAAHEAASQKASKETK